MAKKLHPPPPGEPGQRRLPEDPETEKPVEDQQEEESENEEDN